MALRTRELTARLVVPTALLALAWSAPALGDSSWAEFEAWLGTSTVFVDGFESETTCPWSLAQPPEPDTCTNSVADGCETDVDCGGRACGDCADFSACIVDLDCLSGMCSNGTCAQCLSAENCPGEDTECEFRTCINLTCGTGFTPGGTPTQDQIFGDCLINVCNGSGAPEDVPDDGDVFDTGNQCTIDLCQGGVPTIENEPAGTPCTQNGGAECDGNGNCA